MMHSQMGLLMQAKRRYLRRDLQGKRIVEKMILQIGLLLDSFREEIRVLVLVVISSLGPSLRTFVSLLDHEYSHPFSYTLSSCSQRCRATFHGPEIYLACLHSTVITKTYNRCRPCILQRNLTVQSFHPARSVLISLVITRL
jgi:hypothetical protein